MRQNAATRTRRRAPSSGPVVELALKFTQWTLGTMLVLSMAGGAGLWSLNTRVATLDRKLEQTNDILARALVLVPERAIREGRSDYRTSSQTSSTPAAIVVAEADSVFIGGRENPARSRGSIAQSKGKDYVRYE